MLVQSFKENSSLNCPVKIKYATIFASPLENFCNIPHRYESVN